MREACCVAVRLRPLLKGESVAEDRLVLTNRKVRVHRQGIEKLYAVDHAFVPDGTQEDVFNRSVAPLIPTVLQGVHSTILAYGQTGSGKTFTMQGPPASSENVHTSSGVVPRAIQKLFILRARDSTHNHIIKLSCFQVYCERAYDLLKEPGAHPLSGLQQRADRLHRVSGLRMRMNGQGNFYLENLTEVAVDSVSDAMALYWEAISHKVMGVHDLNDASSRSHIVLQLSVTSAPTAAKDEQRSANLVLVDLAGCERQDQTGIQPTLGTLEDGTQDHQLSGKATQAESIAINKSLMVLRQVVAARSMQDSDKGNSATSKSHRSSAALTHIPYRDSKLTSLLKSGLSGTGRMLMIACIAPSQQHVEGTISSLEYACLARRIRNKATVNEDPRTQAIRKLRAEVAFLKQQLSASQHSLHAKHLANDSTAPSASGHDAEESVLAGSQSTVHGTERYGWDTHHSGQHRQGAERCCNHTEAGNEDSSNVLSTSAATDGGVTGPGGCSQSEQQTQGHSGSDGDENRAGSSGAQCSAAGNTGTQTAMFDLETQTNMDQVMEQIDKGLSPGHLVTKELVDKIVRYAEVSKVLKRSHDELVEANSQLRSKFLTTDQELASVRTSMSTCEAENLELRELGTLLSSVVKGVEGRVLSPADLFTLGRAALMELQELRQENNLLHSRLHKLSAGISHPHPESRQMSVSTRASSSHAPHRPSLSRGGYSVTTSGHESSATAAVAQVLQGRKPTGRLASGSGVTHQLPDRPRTVNTEVVCSQQARGCFTYPGGHREREEVLRRLRRAKSFSSKVNSTHASRWISGSRGKTVKAARNSSGAQNGDLLDSRDCGSPRGPGKEPWQSWALGRQPPLEGGLSEMAERSSQHDPSHVLGNEWRGLGSGAHMHAGPVLLSTTGKLTHGGLIQHALDVHTDGENL